MIELDLEMPLAAFSLRVSAKLAGRTVALFGSSGSGKTSLVESIAGLRPAARGRIAIDGAVLLDSDAGVDLPPERRAVGLVPQDGALFPHLSVRRNIEFAGLDEARLAELDEVLELRPLFGRMPSTLSGGERQRVAIARALMRRPRILLLDEPLASVDQPRKEKIVAALRRLRARFDVPMVYVTHQKQEALALAVEALVLERGTVIASGPAEEVLHREGVGGDEVVNVLEVDDPVEDRERGIIRVRSAGGLELSLPLEMGREAAWPMMIRFGGDDVLVLSERPTGISARNVLEGTIESMVPHDGAVDLRVSTPTLIRVRLTRGSATELGLQPGRRVWLALRTRSIRPIG